MSKVTALVVEDESATVDLLKTILAGERFNVSVAKTVAQARTFLRKGRPDILILDRNLPDMDGLDFCREIRADAAFQTLPVLFLTGRKTTTDKVLGLKFGGDDYLVKPFSPEELLARIDNLLRRYQLPEPQGVLQFGPVKLNIEGRIAYINDKEVELTKKEFDLLRAFLERPNRVLSRTFLLSHVWGYEMELELNTKTVDMMIVGLRRKLGKWGDQIETVKGHGYRVRAPEEN